MSNQRQSSVQIEWRPPDVVPPQGREKWEGIIRSALESSASVRMLLVNGVWNVDDAMTNPDQGVTKLPGPQNVKRAVHDALRAAGLPVGDL